MGAGAKGVRRTGVRDLPGCSPPHLGTRNVTDSVIKVSDRVIGYVVRVKDDTARYPLVCVDLRDNVDHLRRRMGIVVVSGRIGTARGDLVLCLFVHLGTALFE